MINLNNDIGRLWFSCTLYMRTVRQSVSAKIAVSIKKYIKVSHSSATTAKKRLVLTEYKLGYPSECYTPSISEQHMCRQYNTLVKTYRRQRMWTDR
jgi:hypothetical protein